MSVVLSMCLPVGVCRVSGCAESQSLVSSAEHTTSIPTSSERQSAHQYTSVPTGYDREGASSKLMMLDSGC